MKDLIYYITKNKFKRLRKKYYLRYKSNIKRFGIIDGKIYNKKQIINLFKWKIKNNL